MTRLTIMSSGPKQCPLSCSVFRDAKRYDLQETMSSTMMRVPL